MQIDYDVAKFRALEAYRLGFLPPSLELEDLYQEGLLYMLEHPEKDKQLVNASLVNHFRKLADKMRVAPGSAVRCYQKKRGNKLSFGEVSLELLATEDGTWEDFLGSRQDIDSDDVYESSFFTMTLDEATSCLTDIRKQQRKNNDVGISWAKTRNKYHVEVVICGRTQFIGQFIEIQAAREAKQKFLDDFMDAVLDACHSIDDVDN